MGIAQVGKDGYSTAPVQGGGHMNKTGKLSLFSHALSPSRSLSVSLYLYISRPLYLSLSQYVCICACVCVYVCVCVYLHICIFTYLRICVCVRMVWEHDHHTATALFRFLFFSRPILFFTDGTAARLK